MVTYKVEVETGKDVYAGTMNSISVVLIGSGGESQKNPLDRWGKDFHPGARDLYEVKCDKDLGEILVVRLYKEPFTCFPVDDWFCRSIKVTCPNGETSEFPFHLWFSGCGTFEIQQGKGIILGDSVSPVIKKQREEELEQKRQTHKWKTYAVGVPRCINVNDVKELSPNDRFSFLKTVSFGFGFFSSSLGPKLKGFLKCSNSWTDLCDIKRVFSIQWTPISDLVSELWNEDTFFGYQYLNGLNPLMIQKCLGIPDNFPVDDVTVSAILGTSTTLQNELQNGNIFLADYKILQGIPTNVINGETQYLAAPMCLLWKSPQDKVVPIAIQLNQTPGEENPIFLPTDPKWDWTLAKLWVRNSEFQVHEIVSHFLYTHLCAEIFNVATTRHLPMGHPVYKLIHPHLRYTLEINTLARQTLIGPDGFFDQAVVIGNGGVPVLLARATESLTYSALCLPDDIQARGVDSVPNYFYREDGMRIWKAMESYVSNIVHYYYPNDQTVSKDPELQAWVAEIFQEGFLSNTNSGIPSSFVTRVELTKYLTMVMFTCSALHAAVNSGQFDFYSWMPNGPSTMRKPPPTAKGATTYQSILETLPAINTTASTMVTANLLSREPLDRRPLGRYINENFVEDVPKKCVEQFRDTLCEISKDIKLRNKMQKLTYHYLDPEEIECSVSI
ncbi:arachidonate 12-lipoxygenase, 12R type S homeolog [Xenopus laevis]|uniref:Arachidonate 12-lipoxygenase, 12R type S homeolog n=1 Tax=Xenopus laevis TaxID=8355 RepID=Q5FWK8_XENLA|nr:arachidonate 12-lipoxygenase, 12R type S homeolog [Xenopus laevis]AAH89299.1 MGC85124 protein [Xenopus laevis]